MMEILDLAVTTVTLVLLAYWSLTIKRKLRAMDASLAAMDSIHWNSELLLRTMPDDLLPTAPGGWAVGSDLLVEILRTIREQRPAHVVELGSGLSTLVMGLELKKQGAGKLVSIEHDPVYGLRTQAQIEAAGLSDHVEIRIAQLVEQGSGSSPWYDQRCLDDLRQVDLVFVDGPPGTISPRIRERALPFFLPRLNEGGQFLFDDTSREGEHDFIVEWIALHPEFTVKWLNVARGGAIIRQSK